METSVKNLSSERDHIVNLNEDLSLKIVEFEVSVKEMNSQMQSLQVLRLNSAYTDKEINSIKITKPMRDFQLSLGAIHIRINDLFNLPPNIILDLFRLS